VVGTDQSTGEAVRSVLGSLRIVRNPQKQEGVMELHKPTAGG
jgi:hypothetical protein